MALSFAIKSLITVGAFSAIFYTIYLLWIARDLNDIYTWGINMAVTLLAALYSLIGISILLPIKGRLEKQRTNWK